MRDGRTLDFATKPWISGTNTPDAGTKPHAAGCAGHYRIWGISTPCILPVMSQRAWKVPRASVAFAMLICFALSTQLFFQRPLWEQWELGDIVAAWLLSLRDFSIVATAILLCVALAGALPLSRLASRVLWFLAALLTGAALGEWTVLWLQWRNWPTVDLATVLGQSWRWVAIGAVTAAIIRFRQRTQEFDSRIHESSVTRLTLEQQRVELQLQLLQSQIEPHFLFNTLATIRRLHQTDPARGRETLAGFVHYLRCALPEMRSSETTLGREVDLIAAYLDVLQVRMGSRLVFSIDVAPGLREYRIPPLSLATLVENAVKHGLGSLPEGGRLKIGAWLDGGYLILRVADTGTGLTASQGTGMGLANLRVRLRSLYGDDGTLVLAANEPRGLAAMLQIPARHAETRAIHGTA
jgi:signal transduction histidine kinase